MSGKACKKLWQCISSQLQILQRFLMRTGVTYTTPPLIFMAPKTPEITTRVGRFPCYRLNRLISSPRGLVMAIPKKIPSAENGLNQNAVTKKRGTLVPNTWKRRVLAIAMNSDNKHCSWTSKWKCLICSWPVKTVRVRRCHFSNIQQNAARF